MAEPRDPQKERLQEEIDFLTALGEEFCDVLSPLQGCAEICPQDAYEVWVRSFGVPPSAATLSAMSDADVQQLRSECERYLECPAVSVGHLEKIVSRTLRRRS